MMKIFLKIFFITAGAIILNACSRNPYKGTNRSYKKQAKAYAKIISQYPLKDSAVNSPYWIGTTNFNMRKPNFIILHHTAQNSCDQTLKTFTTVRSQVSAHYR